MSELPPGVGEELLSTRPRFTIPFYDSTLKVIEVWVVMVLLLGVVLSTFINILDRNLDLGVWDYALVEKLVYSCIFFIGMFGGVIAARRSKHIAIDAIGHFLSERTRKGLHFVLQLIGGLTCLALASACYDWIYTIVSADETLVEGNHAWWLNTRLWRWPIVISFAWMALHFMVNSGRNLYDVLDKKYWAGKAAAPPAAPVATIEEEG